MPADAPSATTAATRSTDNFFIKVNQLKWLIKK
jgi:hypothetical protein